MAAIETTYGNGGVQTNTEGLPLSAGGDLNSVLAELVRRKLSQPAVQADPGPRQMGMPAQPLRETQFGRRPEAETWDQARSRERVDERAPWRYSYGNPSAPSHPVIPEEFLSAKQRRLYLPQSAGMAPGGADTQTDQEELLRLRAQLLALQGGR